MRNDMEQFRVLLVDDEPLLLESLEIILSMNGQKIIGMASDGAVALTILAREECDLALVDLNMKGMGGIELIARMKEQYPHIKILVLTTFYDDKNITQAIAGGADGYLLKDSGKDAILGALGQIMGGRNVVDAKVMQRLAFLVSANNGLSRISGGMEHVESGTGHARDRAEHVRGGAGNAVARKDMSQNGQIADEYADGKAKRRNILLPDDMTQREKEICTLLSRGLTNRQISETLFISEGTVKNYISSIYDKTGIHDRAKLVAEMNR